MKQYSVIYLNPLDAQQYRIDIFASDERELRRILLHQHGISSENIISTHVLHLSRPITANMSSVEASHEGMRDLFYVAGTLGGIIAKAGIDMLIKQHQRNQEQAGTDRHAFLAFSTNPEAYRIQCDFPQDEKRWTTTGDVIVALWEVLPVFEDLSRQQRDQLDPSTEEQAQWCRLQVQFHELIEELQPGPEQHISFTGKDGSLSMQSIHCSDLMEAIQYFVTEIPSFLQSSGEPSADYEPLLEQLAVLANCFDLSEANESGSVEDVFEIFSCIWLRNTSFSLVPNPEGSLLITSGGLIFVDPVINEETALEWLREGAVAGVEPIWALRCEEIRQISKGKQSFRSVYTLHGSDGQAFSLIFMPGRGEAVMEALTRCGVNAQG